MESEISQDSIINFYKRLDFLLHTVESEYAMAINAGLDDETVKKSYRAFLDKISGLKNKMAQGQFFGQSESLDDLEIQAQYLLNSLPRRDRQESAGAI